MIDKVDSLEERLRLVQQVLEYTMKLRLGNESLWVFVRTVLADGTLGDQTTNALRLLHDFQKKRKDATEESQFDQRVAQTVSWVEKYGQYFSKSTT